MFIAGNAGLLMSAVGEKNHGLGSLAAGIIYADKFFRNQGGYGHVAISD
jgi:hypothetical protein